VTWIEGEDTAVPTDLRYGRDRTVDVVVRKRGRRFDVSDAGRAVELAGKPNDWQEVAERIVDEYAINVNRRGVVFVQSNEQRLGSLITRVAGCSVELYQSFSTAS